MKIEQHTGYLALLGTAKAYLSICSVKDRGRLPGPGIFVGPVVKKAKTDYQRKSP